MVLDLNTLRNDQLQKDFKLDYEVIFINSVAHDYNYSHTIKNLFNKINLFFNYKHNAIHFSAVNNMYNSA